MRRFNQLMILVMLSAIPAVMVATDTGAAMLYSNGTTWVNGSAIPKSSAIFPGDLLQTKSDTVAHINGPALSVIILPDSVIEFQGKALKLEHGAVTVATSKPLVTRAGNISVTPASKNWTEFEVEGLDGSVVITARKGDLLVADGAGTSTLLEGQRTSREGSSSRNRKDAGAAPAANGRLPGKPLIWAGAGVIGAVETWVLLQGDDPLCPK